MYAGYQVTQTLLLLDGRFGDVPSAFESTTLSFSALCLCVLWGKQKSLSRSWHRRALGRNRVRGVQMWRAPTANDDRAKKYKEPRGLIIEQSKE